MIKVEHTKTHKFSIYPDKIEFGQREVEVLVTEAKLVLVPCMRSESLLGYSKYSGYALTDKWLSVPEVWLIPILISETEEINLEN